MTSVKKYGMKLSIKKCVIHYFIYTLNNMTKFRIV
jgi:hypothetical protein